MDIEGDEGDHVGVAAIDEEKQIIHSAVNENDWKLECERVANKLKIQSKPDTKEWRSHIDSTKNCIDSVKKKYLFHKKVFQTQEQYFKRLMTIFLVLLIKLKNHRK